MTDRPNILVIYADQHRFDCLGAYGNPDIKTPNVDALAADGVLYRESFCPYPVCTPSRYSFLSGLYVHQHLGWSNRCTLPQGLPTLPRALRNAGYRTKAVGKMHFTPTYLDLGFEEMALSEQHGAGRYDDDYHRWLRDEGLCDGLDLMDQRGEYRKDAPQDYWDQVGAMASDLDEAHHSTTWIGDRAVETLEGWDGGGHMLMAGFVKPHHPFDPPEPWSRMYDPDAMTILPGWVDEALPHDLAFSAGYFPHQELNEEKVRRAAAYYYATISQMDHHVGRMVDCLKRKGLYEDTVIVYTGDHGEFLGFHHLLLKGNHMYDPLIKVPLIIKFPSQVRAGEVSDALVNSIDMAPTLIRQAGLEAPETMAGLDLGDATADRDLMFAESGRGREYMVRSRTHKLLLDRDETQSLFFDLEADPFELRNLYGDASCRNEIAGYRDALLRWALFDSASPVHLDEGAPVIQGENVPDRGDGHWDELYAYFDRKMTEKP